MIPIELSEILCNLAGMPDATLITEKALWDIKERADNTTTPDEWSILYSVLEKLAE